MPRKKKSRAGEKAMEKFDIEKEAKKHFEVAEKRLKEIATESWDELTPELLNISEKIAKLQAEILLGGSATDIEFKKFYLFKVAIPSLERIVTSRAEEHASEMWEYIRSVVESIAKQVITYAAYAARAAIVGLI